jgi:hypothetical protein
MSKSEQMTRRIPTYSGLFVFDSHLHIFLYFYVFTIFNFSTMFIFVFFIFFIFIYILLLPYHYFTIEISPAYFHDSILSSIFTIFVPRPLLAYSNVSRPLLRPVNVNVAAIFTRRLKSIRLLLRLLSFSQAIKTASHLF